MIITLQISRTDGLTEENINEILSNKLFDLKNASNHQLGKF